MKDLPPLVRKLTDPLHQRHVTFDEVDIIIEAPEIAAHVKRRWEAIQDPVKRVSPEAIKRSKECENLSGLYRR